MYANSGAMRARWAVCWVSKGKMQRKDYGEDFGEALRIYVIACKLDKPHATLVCVNVGFPPPEKYADREEVIVERAGRRFRGKQVIRPLRFHESMHAVNVRGVWWCPYCVTIRRFVRRNGFTIEGIYVGEPSMNCPVCGISHRDGNVRKYNPIAVRYDDMRRVRSDKGVSRG